MKIQDIIQLLENKQLNEINMSPGSLRAFAASPAAKGMRAGFEAELIFTDANESGDTEPDYINDVVPDSIDEVAEFFRRRNSESDIRDLRSALSEKFAEWVDRNVDDNWNSYVRENFINEYIEDRPDIFDYEQVRDRIASENEDLDDDAIDEAVDELRSELINDIADGTSEYHDEVYSAFRDNVASSIDEADWFVETEQEMSDIAYSYNMVWPVRNPRSAFDYDSATNLAYDMSNALGVETDVSDSYHGIERDEVTWIFEPDGSLIPDNANDLAVEIVSPPMELQHCLQMMPKFFAWAKQNSAYANASTGFHMSVSVPDHRSTDLDFTKLILLLGDQHVLEQFGRSASTYAVSALEQFRKEVRVQKNPVAAFDLMRKGLGQLAAAAFAKHYGFGKHYSVNPKEKYVEFRSAGGVDYFKDMDKVLSTLMRYARALSSAMDPAADKQEYLKKLYQVLARDRSSNTDAIALFVKYATNQLSKEALLQQLTSRNRARTNNNAKTYAIVSADDGTEYQRVHSANMADVVVAARKYAKENNIPLRSIEIKPGNGSELVPYVRSDPQHSRFQIWYGDQIIAGIAADTYQAASAMFNTWLATVVMQSTVDPHRYRINLNDTF